MRYGILTGVESGRYNQLVSGRSICAGAEKRRIMATATLISVEEYLATSYEPDAELIDGQLVERNLGEYDHSRLQTKVAGWFLGREREWHIRAVVEQRIRIAAKRYRILDVCVISRDQPIEPKIGATGQSSATQYDLPSVV